MDYTDHITRNVLLNGIYDPDIRHDIRGTLDILTKPVNGVIALIENKEMASNALPSSSLSAMSSFQHLKTQQTSPTQTPAHVDKGKQALCPDCRSTFKVFTEGSRGWNIKPHQVCIECYRARRRKRRQQPVPNSQQSAFRSEPISQISSIQLGSHPGPHRRRHRRRRAPTTHSHVNRPPRTKLEHHIFSKGEWRRANLRDHPRVSITISVDKPAESRASITNHESNNEAKILAIADTGAQSDLWSLEEFLACGFSSDVLHPVYLSLSAANRSPIAIEGGFFGRLSTDPYCSEVTSCRSMVYVSSSVQAMYLSYESLLNLGLLSKDCPSNHSRGGPGHQPTPDTLDAPPKHSLINTTRSINSGCTAPNKQHDAQCSCPQRTVPPPRPAELPFPSTPDNNGRMKGWLLERFASSTFNTCPHRALPCMEGPLIEIHVDPAATPTACHTPANVSAMAFYGTKPLVLSNVYRMVNRSHGAIVW